MVMNLNEAEFNQIKASARELNTSFRYDYFLQPKSDGSKQPLSFRLSPKKALTFEMNSHKQLTKEKKKTQECSHLSEFS